MQQKTSGDVYVKEDIVQHEEKHVTQLDVSEILDLTKPEQATELTADQLSEHLSDRLLLQQRKHCYDYVRCRKLRRPAASICVTCQRRSQRELKVLDFLERLYPDQTKIGLYELLNEDAITNIDPDFIPDVVERKLEIIQEFGCSSQEHWATIAQQLFGPAPKVCEVMAANEKVILDRLNQKNAENVDYQELQPVQRTSKKLVPVFVLLQIVCEYLFNVPGYVGFSLFPLIQAKYAYLLPSTPAAAESEKDVELSEGEVTISQNKPVASLDDLRNGMRIGGTVDYSTETEIAVTVSQIRQFYFDYIQNQSSVHRLMNCLGLSERSGEHETEFLEELDFTVYMSIVCRFHPGLEFLRPTPDFQVSYVDTVVCRIMLENDRKYAGKLFQSEFTRSGLVQELWLIQRSPDLNRLLRYFSYEHFYVIYC